MVDSKEFHQRLTEALSKKKNLTVRMIAHEFGASFPTVERWMSGENYPHEALRDLVLKFVEGV